MITYTGDDTYNYAEETQYASVKYMPVRTKGEDMELFKYPFFCREFMSDIQFWQETGCDGSMYGMNFHGDERGDYIYGQYLALTTCDPGEVPILKEMCEQDITAEVAHQLPDWTCSDGCDDGDEFYRYVGLIRIPDYAVSSPLGMSLWVLGLRGHVENKEITEDAYGFGIPMSQVCGNNEEIFECLGHDLLSFLPVLYKFRKKYLWDIERDGDYMVGECTHEAFSPVTLMSPLTSPRRLERQLEHLAEAEDEGWGAPETYQYEQLVLLAELYKETQSISA